MNIVRSAMPSSGYEDRASRNSDLRHARALRRRPRLCITSPGLALELQEQPKSPLLNNLLDPIRWAGE
jgi:hypothetical protein